MKKCIGLLVGILLLATMWLPRSYDATAIPEQGLSVVYIVKPMFGFHSDWKRSIIVKNGATEIQKELLADTGWWRGSHLYRHTSGFYLIHEGQNGCFGFTVNPLSFDVQTDALCKKNSQTRKKQGDTSQYYTDLKYLGAFVENQAARDGAPISFLSADEKPEIELPDVL